ncbi:MAG: NAD(P)H-binding protein [Polyangiaceae bacterium]
MTVLMVIGATGMVGKAALEQALGDARVTRVVAPTRRALAVEAPGKLHTPVVDFDALPAEADWWKVDGVVCALGTTMRRAGSKEAFRKVDHDYPLAVARLAHAHGARAFAHCSSVGASAKGSSFYLRTKGEVEDALRALGFESLTIARPSFLDGDREESRPMEALGIGFFKVVAPLVPRRYRVVDASRVARALVEGAIAAPPGTRVMESELL